MVSLFSVEPSVGSRAGKGGGQARALLSDARDDRRQDAQLGGSRPGKRCSTWAPATAAIVIDAARKYKANAIGVELDDSLYKQSMDRIKSLGLSATARIIHGDLLKQDYSSADLLTVYLLPVANGSGHADSGKAVEEGRAHRRPRFPVRRLEAGTRTRISTTTAKAAPTTVPLPPLT